MVLRTIHIYLGYLVIILVAARFLQLLISQPKDEPAQGNRALGSITAGLLDLQALLGLAFMMTGGVPPSMLHPLLGIAGAVLGHVGERQAKITVKTGSIWWGITLLLVVVGLSRF